MGILDFLKRIFRLGRAERKEEKPKEEVAPPAPPPEKPEAKRPAEEAVEEEETIEERAKLEEKPAEVMEELERVEEEVIRPKLYPTDPVIKAPEIGLKTAKLLREVGIDTIEELMKTPIREIQRRLAEKGKRVYRATIYRWKVETRLMMEVPVLRIRDVKWLYELKVRSRKDLISLTPEQLYNRLQAFLRTREGQTMAKHYDPPTLDDIRKWIEYAKKAEGKIPEAEMVT